MHAMKTSLATDYSDHFYRFRCTGVIETFCSNLQQAETFTRYGVVADGKLQQHKFMQNLQSIRKQAKIIVRAMHGPLGTVPFEHVIREHSSFFDKLRHRGVSWEQIARLLNSEGLVSPRGKPIPASVLRSQYSRVQRNRPNRIPSVSEKPQTRKAAPATISAQSNGGPISNHRVVADAMARAQRLRAQLPEEI
ncbi:hypothetical protein H7Q97_04505 [Ochrobactrum sp. CM-21-5]|nr:hypothetical protein [Ochrobactrum sp. CM-21-5]MBC2884663.1 hypothetical protein [Ochrobactrum sp. CM-21-5]